MEKPLTVDELVQRVTDRRNDLLETLEILNEELRQIDTFLEIKSQHTGEPPRMVSGSEVDELCMALLSSEGRPLKPAEMLALLKTRYNVEVEAMHPAKLVSTRMARSPKVEATDNGWQLKAAITRSPSPSSSPGSGLVPVTETFDRRRDISNATREFEEHFAEAQRPARVVVRRRDRTKA